MLISPKAVLVRVAERMTDYELGYEFELNSETVCLSAFNFALATISQLTPDAFSTVKKVELHQGDIQKIDECDRILKVGDVYVDKEYSNTPDAMSDLNNKLRKLQKHCNPCPSRRAYQAQYMSVAGLNTLKVYPPVPDDVTVEVEILCACTPQAKSVDDSVDVAQAYVPVIEEFMLYYLYDIDMESVPNRARSSLHWQIATSLLGVTKNVPQLQRAEE